MAVFALFMVVLVIGLLGVAYILKGVMARSALSQDSKVVPTASVTFSSDPAAEIVEHKALMEALQIRVPRLEQMLVEKNRIIAELQAGIKPGQDHNAQVDDLKKILQSEIDSLKDQNRRLKAEMERLAGENLDLQTRLFAAGQQGPSEPGMKVRPMASSTKQEGDTGLSLQDVFSH